MLGRPALHVGPPHRWHEGDDVVCYVTFDVRSFVVRLATEYVSSSAIRVMMTCARLDCFLENAALHFFFFWGVLMHYRHATGLFL